MGINIHELDDQVREDIANNMGLGDNIEEVEERLKHMSAANAFECWCEWNGFIGYSRIIADALDNIRKAATQEGGIRHG